MGSAMEEELVLPGGRVLKFDLLETWGDPDYIGLTGVELFAADGEMIKVTAESIKGYNFALLSHKYHHH